MPGENRSWITPDLLKVEEKFRQEDQLNELNRQLDELFGIVAGLRASVGSITSGGYAGRSETPTHLGGGVYRLQNTPLTGTLQVFVKFPTSSGQGAWVLLVEPDEYTLSGNQFVLVGGALPTGSKVKCWYVW